MEGSSKENKIIYIEVLRILAALLVVFSHTGSKGWFIFSKFPTSEVWFWGGLFLSVLIKIGSTIFFAISGALLLGRSQEALSITYKKRIFKTFLALTLFSFFYYYLNVVWDGKKVDIIEFFKGLYLGNYVTSFWFLYAYIAMLMTLPLLKSFVQNLEDKYFYYLITISYVCFMFPPVKYIMSWPNYNSSLNPYWLFCSIFIFPCTGYFLHHRIKNISPLNLTCLWCLNLISMFIIGYATYCKVLATGVCNEQSSQSFHDCAKLINMITIFMTVKYFCLKSEIKPILSRVLISIGSCTFGIYLLHELFLFRFPLTWKLGYYLTKVFSFGEFSTTLIIVLWTFVCGCLTTLVLKKIPYIRMIL